MFVAEGILSKVVEEYGKHQVTSDDSNWYPSQACKFLNLHHHIHSSFKKSLIERTMQYIKDRIESFDDCFPCNKNRCKLNHIELWINIFIDQQNKEIIPPS
jgi:putative transposase